MLVFLQLSGLIRFVLNITQTGLLFFLAINVSSHKKERYVRVESFLLLTWLRERAERKAVGLI